MELFIHITEYTHWVTLILDVWSHCMVSHAVIQHHTAHRIGGLRNGDMENVETEKWELG